MKFIINLLSAMGLGANAIVLSAPSFLFNLGRQFPKSNFKLVDFTDTRLIIEIETDNEISHLIYTLDNMKIVDVQYTMGT